MEMIVHSKQMRNSIAIIATLLLLLCPVHSLKAQAPIMKYGFSKGNMQIQLSKNLDDKSLADFIQQYDIADLALKQLLRNDFKDSVLKKGWTIDVNNNDMLVISKPLQAVENIDDPGIRINISTNLGSDSRPIPLNSVSIGTNNFRNEQAFTVKDSTVIFTFTGNKNASNVLLAGNFSNWQNGAIRMNKTGNGWQTTLKLAPGKYWYKYIVDGNWTNDPANALVEGDGEGNNNSVFYVPNYIFKLDGNENVKRVFLAGSFSNWEDGKLRMYKTAAGWELPVFLNAGTYTYRFIVNNNWIVDPANPNKMPNEFDDFNSVVSIGKPVLFSLAGLPDAVKVYLMGSFNQWRKFELAMKKTVSGWELPYVLGAGNYEYKFIVDGTTINAQGQEVSDFEPGSVFVIEPNYTFRLKGFDNAKTIYVAGDFNGWSPNGYPMKKEADEWVLPLHLNRGKHLYKFVVDGKWIIDPANKLWEENEHSTGNSIVWIEN